MDLHKKAFDEGTICKLEIFEAYTKAWLPTFIMQDAGPICIFDLFAGPGYDIGTVEGSPIRILRQVINQAGNIFQRKVNVCIWLNEYIKEKYDNLVQSCESFINDNVELSRMRDCKKLSIKFTNSPIDDIFHIIISHLNNYPSLIFMDQNGIKFMNDEYFMPIIGTHTTDFLFFSSSSYIRRFSTKSEFVKNISFDLSKVKDGYTQDIHRWVVKQLQNRIPVSSRVRLYPFSIKKGKNVYGIIFGASHPRAVDKFLDLAWSKNELNGEANFDIDADEKKSQLDLFEGKKLSKIEQFQQDLSDSIMSGQITNNKDAYNYTIERGHLSAHADSVIRQMKKDGRITYGSKTPMCNYNQVYKNKVIINYNVV